MDLALILPVSSHTLSSGSYDQYGNAPSIRVGLVTPSSSMDNICYQLRLQYAHVFCYYNLDQPLRRGFCTEAHKASHPARNPLP
jgi:hypothetical protein